MSIYRGSEDPFELVDSPERSPWATRATKDAGLIYFVGPAGRYGPLKIGFCYRLPRERLRDLQTGYPFPLVLHVAVPGLKRDEARLHRTLESEKLHGEWFRASPRIRRLVVYLKAGRHTLSDPREPIIAELADAVDSKSSAPQSENRLSGCRSGDIGARQ